jgi:hypothetical protein
MIFTEKVEEGSKSTRLQDVIAASGRVTSDVTKSPDGLFPDVKNG